MHMKNLLILIVLLSLKLSFWQSKSNEIREVSTEQEITTIRFAYINEAPVHPKCEKLLTDKDKKQCTRLKIQKHFENGFNYKNLICTKKELKKNKKEGKENDCIESLAKGQ